MRQYGGEDVGLQKGEGVRMWVYVRGDGFWAMLPCPTESFRDPCSRFQQRRRLVNQGGYTGHCILLGGQICVSGK